MRRLWEAWLVWLLFGLTTVAVFVTYWRLPPTELWKTTHGGFVGGAGRAFVFLSFSAAVVAPVSISNLAAKLMTCCTPSSVRNAPPNGSNR